MRVPGVEASRGLGAFVLDLLYPQRCVNCGSFGKLLCGKCAVRVPRLAEFATCPLCCAQWDQPLNCPRCQAWDPLDGCRAVFEMAGPARAAVHGLKYRYQRGLAPVMAGEMTGLPGLEAFDFAYPVPLHGSRERSRGFNQAGLLLRELGWTVGPGRLARVRRTGRQVGLGLRDRRRNVAGAFQYRGPSLEGKRIALVDDVVTTGATARECAVTLKEHGAARVVVLAYARASYRHTSASQPILEDA